MRAYWYRSPAWTDKVGNVGDIVTPHLIRYVTGEDAVWTDTPGRVLASGSILEFVQDNDILWGCGLIQPMPLPKRSGVKVAMVRGHHTLKALNDAGYDVSDTILGDPCQLLPEIFPAEKTNEFIFGFVLHYVDAPFEQQLREEGYHIIHAVNDIETFVHEINRCEIIHSSSLHGLVIARAYGIMAFHKQLSDKVIGGCYKFTDYLTSTFYNTPTNQQIKDSLLKAIRI